MGFAANYLRNLASLAVGREPMRPLFFSLYVTHRCALHCSYCAEGDGRPFKQDPVDDPSLDQVKRLLRILRRSGDTLDLTGGEPMIRDDLEEILLAAKSLGFQTVLNTKAMGLDKRPEVLRLTDVMVIGVDSMQHEHLSKVMGSSIEAARAVIRGVEYAASQRHATRTQVTLSPVVTPDNVQGAREVLHWALDHGLSFELSPQTIGPHVHPGLRDNAGYRALVDELIELKRSRRGVMGVPDYLKGIRGFADYRCHPMLLPKIRPDARLYYPCLERMHADVSILEAGSYERALEQARALRGDLPVCRDCCHCFCHMAISLFQRQPWRALQEGRHWKPT
ncbi:MAG: radical SAM protein [Deltaproteobacteria bacterium]|nr:radical SAM protein [Deltaproteobacteria bacterium]